MVPKFLSIKKNLRTGKAKFQYPIYSSKMEEELIDYLAKFIYDEAQRWKNSMFEDILEKIEEIATLEEDKEIIYPPEPSHSSEEELSKHRWLDFHGDNSSPFMIPLTLWNAKIQN